MVYNPTVKHEPEIEKQCEVCGARFVVLASIARKKPCKFCSIPCALTARRKPVTIERCMTCGKGVKLSPWQTKRNGKFGHFCGSKCYGKWRTENLTAENSPNWRGGLTMDYGGSGWKAARRKARERDGHKCQGCGITDQIHGYQLDVHHRKPFDMFDDPKQASAQSNLVTLCRQCHAKEHSGKGRFTVELLPE